jgi:hypothetical protein
MTLTLPPGFHFRNRGGKSYPQQVELMTSSWTVLPWLARITTIEEGPMKTLCTLTSLTMIAWISAALATPHSLMLTNHAGSPIMSITAIEKTAPDKVLPFGFANELSAMETDATSIDLPEDVCVVDVTYNLASGEKIVQQNVDLCNIDGVVVE